MHIRLGADTPTGMSRLKYCRANSVQCGSLLLGRIMKYGVWYVCVVTDNSAPEPHPPPFPGPAQWALCLAKERSVCWKGGAKLARVFNCCLNYSGGGARYQRIYHIK